jgi:hypothetical protein
MNTTQNLPEKVPLPSHTHNAREDPKQQQQQQQQKAAFAYCGN